MAPDSVTEESLIRCVEASACAHLQNDHSITSIILTPPISPVLKPSLPQNLAASNTLKDVPATVLSGRFQLPTSGHDANVSQRAATVREICTEHGEHTPAAFSAGDDEETARVELTGDPNTKQAELVVVSTANCEDISHETVDGTRVNFNLDTVKAVIIMRNECDEVVQSKIEGQHEHSQLYATPKVLQSDKSDNSFTKEDTAINGVNEARSVKDGSDTAVEVSKHDHSAEATLPRSVPHYMRLQPRTLTLQQTGLRDTRRNSATLPPHTPRGFCPTTPLPFDFDEPKRTRAQPTKANNELELERKINAKMQKTVGAETRTRIGSTMSDMFTDVLCKQADELTAKTKVQAKERELQYREEKITQLEIYLSSGQRQLKYQLQQQGIRPMSLVDESHLRRNVEIEVRHQFSDLAGKISIQSEQLLHKEAILNTREQHHKTLMRDSLEAEIRAELSQGEHNKPADAKAVEVAYQRGFAEGERAGQTKCHQAALKQEFLKGYSSCYRSQTALHNLRNGRVAADSPQLSFLYDPTNLEHPYLMGLSIGRIEAAIESTDQKTVEADDTDKLVRGPSESVCPLQSRSCLMNKLNVPMQVAAEAGGSELSTHTITLQSHGQTQSDSPEPVLSTRMADRPEKAHQDEAVGKAPPPRLTFAGELRGFSSATNKKSSLANKSYPQDTLIASKLTTTTPVSSRKGARMEQPYGYKGEGIYTGRRTVNYKADSDDEPAFPNLIDLY